MNPECVVGVVNTRLGSRHIDRRCGCAALAHRASFHFLGLKSTKARYIAKEIYIQAGNITSAKKPGYLRLPGLVKTPGYTLYIPSILGLVWKL